MKTLIQLNTCVVQANNLLASPIDDELVMTNLATGKYYGLDPVSTRIWELLAQPRALGEVCQRLCEEFEVEKEQCQQDVVEFIQKLVDTKLAKTVAT